MWSTCTSGGGGGAVRCHRRDHRRFCPIKQRPVQAALSSLDRSDGGELAEKC
jgi:hypothetical protein